MQLGAAAVIVGVVGVLYITQSGPDYAQGRLASYLSGAADLTQADDHIQQAIKAFTNGGWTGVGLGQGRQKFERLPAPHTDSIFAVIGEELGILGASLVVVMAGVGLMLSVSRVRLLQNAPRRPVTERSQTVANSDLGGRD
ncbi:MAG: hypothetical protein DPW23_03060, partial [Gammaproteobacteria bacterium]|nr:hypothetical protein [Gammaproteobacteria bacterium]